MSSSDPRSWIDKAVRGCFLLLLGALALFVAVTLIEHVWVVILIGVLVVGATSVAVAMVRNRSRGW